MEAEAPRKRHDGRSSLRMIALVVSRYRLDTVLTVGALLASGILEGLGIAALLPFLDVIVSTGEAGNAESSISRAISSFFATIGVEPTIEVMLLLVVAIIFLKAVFGLLAWAQIAAAGARVAADMRHRLVQTLLQARWSHFIVLEPGRIAGAITNESRRGANAYISTSKMVAGALRVAVMLWVAMLISWSASLAAIAFGALAVILFSGIVRKSRHTGQRETDLIASLSSQLVDGIAGMKPIKAMGREGPLATFLRRDIKALQVVTKRRTMLLSYLPQLTEPLTVVALAVGIYLFVGQADMTLEALIVLALAFSRIVSAITSIQAAYQTIASVEAGFWFVEELVNDAESAAEPGLGARSPTFDTGATFRNVSFTYGGRNVLDSVDLYIQARRFHVIRGSSGVGKTTLIDLLLGLHIPQDGTIEIDGVDLREIDIKAWRHRVGYVPQEMFLFHDTVLANITLGNKSISRSAVERSLRLAGAFEFISELPNGVDTVVGEKGARLSGGQRQRIAIARALVDEPFLLVLDEATASLDPETTASICKTLRGLSEHITILAISHEQRVADAADIVLEVYDQTVTLVTDTVSESV